MYNSLYLLNVIDNEEIFPYPYNKLQTAENHFDFEQTSCKLYEYIDGQYKLIKQKIIKGGNEACYHINQAQQNHKRLLTI